MFHSVDEERGTYEDAHTLFRCCRWNIPRLTNSHPFPGPAWAWSCYRFPLPLSLSVVHRRRVACRFVPEYHIRYYLVEVPLPRHLFPVRGFHVMFHVTN